MHTLTTDNKKRVRIPDAQPGTVYAYENEGGRIVLTPVKAEASEPFPPGSLLKYFSGPLGKERDELESILLKGCVTDPE